MPAEGRATISSEITSRFPTNNIKYITALLLREFEEIINISKFNLVDDDAFDINFNDASFAATNVGDALLELNSLVNGGTIPLFYVDANITSDGFSFLDVNSYSTNYSGTVTVTGNATGTLTINHTSTITELGLDTGYAICNFRNSQIHLLDTTATVTRFSTSGAFSNDDIRIYIFPEPSNYVTS